MQWSKLRSTVESRFAPALGRRVSLHQARYRYTNNAVGRVWIAIDGRDAASFQTDDAPVEIARETARLMDERDAWGSMATYMEAVAEAEGAVRAAGVYSDRDAIAELRAFLAMPVDEALASPSPLLRALAMLDARVGKRRLKALAASPDQHPLVRTLLAVRCDAEGVRIGPRSIDAASPEPGEE
jgi:hypothetical protein